MAHPQNNFLLISATALCANGVPGLVLHPLSLSPVLVCKYGFLEKLCYWGGGQGVPGQTVLRIPPKTGL